jgi:hypothetical protein
MTAAWHGFIHAWHTLGILLKWMCITVVGIPFAVITCVAIGLCAIAFAALCIAALVLAIMLLCFTIKAIIMLITRPRTWIKDFKISRAERDLLRLPTVNSQAPIEQRVVQTFPRGYLQTIVPETALLPPPNTHVPFQAMVQITSPPLAHIGQAISTNVATPVASLPSIMECQICLDEKLPEHFPSRTPTDSCFHESTDCCRECLSQHITSNFEGNVWNDVRCPICNLRLEHKDVAEFATPEIFQRSGRF